MSNLFDGTPDRLPADGDLVALVRERHRLNVDRDIIATAKDPLTCALSPLSLAIARLAARSDAAPWRSALKGSE